MMTGRAGAVLVLRRAADNPAAVTCTPGLQSTAAARLEASPHPGELRPGGRGTLGGPGPAGDTGRGPAGAAPTAETSGTSQSCSREMRAAGGGTGLQWKVPTVPAAPVLFAVPAVPAPRSRCAGGVRCAAFP